MDGSARLFYYAPRKAYDKAKKARAERLVAVEEFVAETLYRLFLKPGSDHYNRLIEELTKGGKLVLMFDRETESSYVFKLYGLKEGGGLVDLGVKLRIEKVEKGEGIVYTLVLDAERWLGFFKQELEAAMKAAEEIAERLPVEDRLPYMLGWVSSDVAITRKGNKRVLEMSTSHLWQLAETHALFGWSVVGLRMSLTLEGPKLQVIVETPLERLDEAIRISAEGGWLRMLSDRGRLEDLKHVKSWDDLKRWVAEHWDEVIDAVKRRLEGVKAGSGFDLVKALEELEGLKSRLDDDKMAREVVAPALLLIQAERLGVNEETLRYFAAVISGAVGGDGHVSKALKRIELTSGEREIALLWAAVFEAHGIEAEVRRVGGAFHVTASGGDAARLADLYSRYGAPLLEGGDNRLKNHKLAEAVVLGAEGLNVSWEGLKRTEDGLVAADLIISVGGVAVKYNVYLRGDAIELELRSTDRSHAELAALLLKLVGVDAEVKKEGVRDEWHVRTATDMLTAGREELRKALAEVVRRAMEKG